MANFNKFNVFVADLAGKVHNLNSDQLTVALTAAANVPVATNTVLANLTEISYTGFSSRNITTASSSQTAGVYTLVLTTLVLTASATTATFRYVVLYNSTTASKNLIGWYDVGFPVTLNNNDTFTIAFNALTGALTLT